MCLCDCSACSHCTKQSTAGVFVVCIGFDITEAFPSIMRACQRHFRGIRADAPAEDRKELEILWCEFRILVLPTSWRACLIYLVVYERRPSIKDDWHTRLVIPTGMYPHQYKSGAPTACYQTTRHANGQESSSMTCSSWLAHREVSSRLRTGRPSVRFGDCCIFVSAGC